jgi:hypothetical protein
MQVRHPIHVKRCIKLTEQFQKTERILDDDMRRFFKLFTQSSTFEGSQTAARKMENIAARETRLSRTALLFHSLYLLLHTPDAEKLLWPNSPLLVLLQFVDPNMLTGDEHEALQEGATRSSLLHHLAILADPTSSDYSTHKNQLTLGRQLIEHGANINAVNYPDGDTPLHIACFSHSTTNLDFIELLLENGADPNAQNALGQTPLMETTAFAPGAAKVLLEWPTTDVGASFLANVREAVEYFVDKVEPPDNLGRVEHRFLSKQWREIEEMLVERGAIA